MEYGDGRTTSYAEFLESKRAQVPWTGFEVEDAEINPMLFDFQRDIVRWALRRGKAAIFADCGMGKTPMQLAWADAVCRHVGGGTALIVAPLAVSAQTRREGEKFGVPVNIVRDASQLVEGVNITNYEMLAHFEGSALDAVVLDESSILKSYAGKVRTQLIEMLRDVPYKLACTATPSPNDYEELGNHSEFLDAMSRMDMLAVYFTNDGTDTHRWVLKGHARSLFWDWVGSWACMITKPSDMGYPDDGFELPEMELSIDEVETELADGEIVRSMAVTLQDQRDVRRDTMPMKVEAIAKMVNGSEEPWIVWCNLNAESLALSAAIPDAVEVKGSDSADHKESAMVGFSDGTVRVLVTKPSIAGFGMNWQHCSHMAFCGLSHSYEQFYQAVRRCYRYGQKEKVEVHVVTADRESVVVANVMRKKEDSAEMVEEMVKRSALVRESVANRAETPYCEADARGESWELKMGDCVERMREIPDDSIHFSVFSPPFASLYTFSDSARDMSNVGSKAEFFEHFSFLVDELYRAMMPGRIVAVHCSNLPLTKNHDGVIGVYDFRGDLIRAFQQGGFIYHSEICIRKDPVQAMYRSKSIRLLNKQKNKDSCMSGQAIPDYLVMFRKPGANPEPVTHDNEHFSIPTWQKIAEPVWMDVLQGNTLQFAEARDADDERHLCPLQLEVIERVVKMWTNPGDTVLSPFAGIGSEGFESVKYGRRFVGIELKPSYFAVAVKNLAKAEEESKSMNLFDFLHMNAYDGEGL